MNKFNTKTLINLLPFDPKQKLELLESYDNLPKEEQIKVSRIVWDAYAEYEELKINDNFEKGFETGEFPLDENYYKAIVAKTEKEIDEELENAAKTVDLTNVRQSMEKILKEINASKININKQNTP